MNREGYMFSLDAIVAVVIIAITAAILIATIPQAEPDYFIDRLSWDIIGVLSHTTIDDLCMENTGTWDCPNYDDLELMLNTYDDAYRQGLSVIEYYSLSYGIVDADIIADNIHEIFASSKVIDETNLGFSLLYTVDAGPPETLYNTEEYSGGATI